MTASPSSPLRPARSLSTEDGREQIHSTLEMEKVLYSFRAFYGALLNIFYLQVTEEHKYGLGGGDLIKKM